ncbi:B12-binding domain-containing radical SAM protein [candidate division KSB1 bacterium]|nr:B12-binding domain-containing radical SAM protein [candidate division KSB1 bacterium]
MSEIVLINPRVTENRSSFKGEYAGREPLGVLALGSFLHGNKYNVEIIDANLYYENDVREMLESVLHESTIFVGFSVMTSQIPHALELSDYLKKGDKKPFIIWGGIHPTLFPKQTSLNQNVDLVIYGPGEATSLEVAKQVESGDYDFQHIQGVSIGGRINDAREKEDINTFPFFNYDLLDIKRSLKPSLGVLFGKDSRSLNIISSRGCPWRCTFCINYATKNRWRGLTSERFLDELEYHIDRYKLEAVRILDEDFFVNEKRVTAFIEGMEKRDIRIKWGTNARANYFNEKYITLDFAKRLKNVGCNFLGFGAESGSNRILKLLKKDISTGQILHSAKICANAGIRPRYSWMIGIPGQSKEEMKSNIFLMREINKICPEAMHTTNWIYRPWPGGELYNTAKKEGLKEPKSLSEWVSFGVDKKDNTGSYSAKELPWIEDHIFVEFLSRFTPHIIAQFPERLSQRSIVGKIVKVLYWAWDWKIWNFFVKTIARILNISFDKKHSQ